MTFRKVVFWLHLLAGVIAGGVILIMSITGAALAFEKDIVAWAERDVRRVAPPTAAAERLPLDDLLARVQEKKPGERPSGITLDADPNTAVLVSFGRTHAFYLNPYTGEVCEQGAQGVRAFMQTMIAWHRYLGGHDENRALGKAITGACNAAFLFLAVSGLYLWWPRQWTQNAFRSIGVMNFKLSGKARDWNWHNTVGFWTAPVLIVLTATAMPISYQWAGNLIYRITRSPLPNQGSTSTEMPTPPAGAKPLSLAMLFGAAQKEIPNWKQINQRSANPGGRSQRPGGGASGFSTSEPLREARSESTPARDEHGGESRRTPQPVTLTVIEQDAWPRFSNTQLALDPFTGEVLRKEGFGDLSTGRQVRAWTRFLHTGEALGTIGKAVAGLASAAAALLVWTGFALAWRRCFPKRGLNPAATTGNSALQIAAKE